jgi:hypothetical protein
MKRSRGEGSTECLHDSVSELILNCSRPEGLSVSAKEVQWETH